MDRDAKLVVKRAKFNIVIMAFFMSLHVPLHLETKANHVDAILVETRAISDPVAP